jgi:hypothetical protein
MKTIDLAKNQLSLDEALRSARGESLLLRCADGEQFVVSDIHSQLHACAAGAAWGRFTGLHCRYGLWHSLRVVTQFGWVAQLVEQRTENPCVGGSIPPPATTPHETIANIERNSLLTFGIMRQC